MAEREAIPETVLRRCPRCGCVDVAQLPLVSGPPITTDPARRKAVVRCTPCGELFIWQVRLVDHQGVGRN